MEIDDEPRYQALDQLADPIRKAITEIDNADTAILAQRYTAAMKENRAQVAKLRRAGCEARRDDEQLTWRIVDLLAGPRNEGS